MAKLRTPNASAPPPSTPCSTTRRARWRTSPGRPEPIEAAGPLARRRLPPGPAPPRLVLRRSGGNPAAAAGHRRCRARSRGCSASPTCAARCCRWSTSSSSWKASARVVHEGQRVLVVRQTGGNVAVIIDELFGQRTFNDSHRADTGRRERRPLRPFRQPGLPPGRHDLGRVQHADADAHARIPAGHAVVVI